MSTRNCVVLFPATISHVREMLYTRASTGVSDVAVLYYVLYFSSSLGLLSRWLVIARQQIKICTSICMYTYASFPLIVDWFEYIFFITGCRGLRSGCGARPSFQQGSIPKGDGSEEAGKMIFFPLQNICGRVRALEVTISSGRSKITRV